MWDANEAFIRLFVVVVFSPAGLLKVTGGASKYW